MKKLEELNRAKEEAGTKLNYFKSDKNTIDNNNVGDSMNLENMQTNCGDIDMGQGNIEDIDIDMKS